MAAALQCAAADAPRALKCENLKAPVAVNTNQPRFSWQNSTHSRQTAYEILVGSDSLALLQSDRGDVWQSGVVPTTASTLVSYGGQPLPARAQCWWKVRITAADGTVSPWSSVERFGVGVVGDDAPLAGAYIGMPAGVGEMRAPLLRKQFSYTPATDGSRVICHVNSLGYHELYVNGVKVGNNVLSPGVSQLGKRSLIVSYDITDLLTAGTNNMVLWLGQGWFKSTTFNAPYAGPVVKAEVDGVLGTRSTLLFATDGSWTACESGYHDTDSWNALRFGGEHVDGAKLPTNLSAETLNSRLWVNAAEVEIPAHMLTPEQADRNVIAATLQARRVVKLADGVWMVDMGTVNTGWFEMQMPKLPAGREVRMEYSDNLTPQGEFDAQGEADVYVAAGHADERFCNKFHHHAFRYVKVTGLDSEPTADMFRCHAIHGDYADASSFECSDADINAIHNMIKHTMTCLTLSGYMVDCPHLERQGYGGDGNSSTLTLQTMFDVAPTFTNWMQAWGDVMQPDGGLPHVAPAGGGGGGPYWCAFMVFAPWRTYVNYNDVQMLQTYYPLMKRWMDYVDRYCSNGLLHRWPDTDYRGWYLGDWLAPAGVDAGNAESVDLVNNCVVSESLAKLEKIARVLGLEQEAEMWAKRRMQLNATIHATFYHPGEKMYATGSQLDMCYPMLVGATPSYLMPEVSQQMLELSRTRFNGHIAAGLVGVPIVTEWAIANQQPDFIYSMLKQRDYPGYLYMIDNGATATWEYWSGERSRVHNCYNGIGLWFYRGIGGIIPDEEAPGYTHLTINPQMPQAMQWANVSKLTPLGTVKVEWSKGAGSVTYSIDIPSGATATVLPPSGAVDLTVSGNDAAEAAVAGTTVNLPSGSYTIHYSVR